MEKSLKGCVAITLKIIGTLTDKKMKEIGEIICDLVSK
jgi:hypothetical protein